MKLQTSALSNKLYELIIVDNLGRNPCALAPEPGLTEENRAGECKKSDLFDIIK